MHHTDHLGLTQNCFLSCCFQFIRNLKLFPCICFDHAPTLAAFALGSVTEVVQHFLQIFHFSNDILDGGMSCRDTVIKLLRSWLLLALLLLGLLLLVAVLLLLVLLGLLLLRSALLGRFFLGLELLA